MIWCHEKNYSDLVIGWSQSTSRFADFQLIFIRFFKLARCRFLKNGKFRFSSVFLNNYNLLDNKSILLINKNSSKEFDFFTKQLTAMHMSKLYMSNLLPVTFNYTMFNLLFILS